MIRRATHHQPRPLGSRIAATKANKTMMARGPSAYFGRVAKKRIVEAVREGVSVEAAWNIAGLKKQAMAEAAAQRLAGTGWFPELLRTTPIIERETGQAA